MDVNKDGIFKSEQDEFIEIVNISGIALDISNLLISDNTKVRHTVPFGTVLQNLEPIVHFLLEYIEVVVHDAAKLLTHFCNVFIYLVKHRHIFSLDYNAFRREELLDIKEYAG